ASGFFLYGIALIYGATGSTNLDKIGAAVRAGAGEEPLLLIRFALLLVGVGFKISAVPFHMLTTAVFQGAPTPVAAFIPHRAHLGDGLHRPRVQGRRFHRAPARAPRLAAASPGGVGVALLGARRAQHDARERGGPRPAESQAHARLFLHRPRWLHAGGHRGR